MRILLLLVVASFGLAATLSTGFNQVGAVHLRGPNGLDAVGAYHFLMPSLAPGEDQKYQFKIVLFAPISGYPPDMVYTSPVRAWGDPLGHYWWSNGEWTLEMVGIEETIRQQVAWEAERMGYKPGPGSSQRVDVTIGKDTILITCSK